MAPQIVLISGCSSGIGLSTAVLLAKDPEKRFKVYATMRNLAKKGQLEEEGKEHVGDTLIIEQMDVCCDESVNKTVQDVIDKEGRIDVLFNNAGVTLFSVEECTPIKMAQEMFDVNFFGVLRLMKAVLPNMKARESGHIIVNSSVGGIVGTPFVGIYGASKFAVEGLAESLTPSLRQFNIRCTMLEPGPVKTPIVKTATDWGQTIDYSTVDEKTKQQMQEVGEAFIPMIDSALMPGQVTEVVKEIILSEKTCFRYQTNEDYLTEEIACKFTDPTGDKTLEMITRRFFGNQKGDSQ